MYFLMFSLSFFFLFFFWLGVRPDTPLHVHIWGNWEMGLSIIGMVERRVFSVSNIQKRELHCAFRMEMNIRRGRGPSIA